MADCIFCKVANGEVNADVVRRSADAVAFRDINPQAPTHLLVIPTHHVASLNEVRDEGVLGRLLAFARDTAAEVGLGERGYRVVVNTNAEAGQTVFHLHLHVLGGRPMRWPPG